MINASMDCVVAVCDWRHCHLLLVYLPHSVCLLDWTILLCLFYLPLPLPLLFHLLYWPEVKILLDCWVWGSQLATLRSCEVQDPFGVLAVACCSVDYMQFPSASTFSALLWAFSAWLPLATVSTTSWRRLTRQGDLHMWVKLQTR